MSSSELAENLRLVCSYADSISAACKRMGINRQQFHRYLSGDSYPSLRSLRRISDYFGLEESELLLDHASFRKLIAVKRPVAGEISVVAQTVRDILLLTPQSQERLSEHTGYYYNYFCPAEHPGKILRAFIRVTEDSGFILSRNIERYPGIPHRTTRKYSGIFSHSGEKILMFERENAVGKMVWLTVLYPNDKDQPSLLPGLTIGVTNTVAREIACYRVVLQYLGRSVELRKVLGRCGLFDIDDPHIDPAIRFQVQNDMHPDEPAFALR